MARVSPLLPIAVPVPADADARERKVTFTGSGPVRPVTSPPTLSRKISYANVMVGVRDVRPMLFKASPS